MRYRTVAVGIGLVLLSATAFAAVDSDDKRGSVLNMTGYVLPFPDSSIGAADRAHLAGVYRGISGAAPAAAVAPDKNQLGFGLHLN